MQKHFCAEQYQEGSGELSEVTRLGSFASLPAELLMHVMKFFSAEVSKQSLICIFS
jgi:hypothetical protein